MAFVVGDLLGILVVVLKEKEYVTIELQGVHKFVFKVIPPLTLAQVEGS